MPLSMTLSRLSYYCMSTLTQITGHSHRTDPTVIRLGHYRRRAKASRTPPLTQGIFARNSQAQVRPRVRLHVTYLVTCHVRPSMRPSYKGVQDASSDTGCFRPATGRNSQHCVDALYTDGHRSKPGAAAYTEGKSQLRAAVVEGLAQEDVLRRVLYPEAHGNGFKKKKKPGAAHVHSTTHSP